MDQDQPKRIRRYASTFGILILLAAVLGFYYFKYVPQRRTEYNRAAFLELTQIEHALRNQDGAYRNALQNIVDQDAERNIFKQHFKSKWKSLADQ